MSSGPACSHVRLLVFDALGRLLLAKRRDPVTGDCVWEPPGGAIDPGETRERAGERELQEETGIVVKLSAPRWVDVHREYRWKKENRVRDEAICTLSVGEVTIAPEMPTEEERATFLEWRWVAKDELSGLDAPIYPEDPFALRAEIES